MEVNAPHRPPRHVARLWVLLAVVCTGSLAALLLLGLWNRSRIFEAYDLYSVEYFRWVWGWRTLLSEGELPEWNPYMFGGTSFIGSFAFSPFHPPAWFFIPLPASLAMTARVAFSYMLAGLGFYGFARSIAIPRGAALLSALLFEAGNHIVTLANPGHIHKIEAIAWAPWAMAAAVIFTRRPSTARSIILAVPLALMLTASHPQIFYAIAGLSAMFVLFGGLGGNILRASHGKRVRLLGYLLLTFVICFALVAIQLLPAMDFSAQSNRAEGVSMEEAGFGGLPPNEIVEMVLPSIRGDSTGIVDPVARWLSGGNTKALPYMGQWHGPDNPERLVSDYIGVWAAVLALAGLILARGQRKPWFFLGATVVTVLIATGDAWPFFGLAHRFVPGFNKFRSPATFIIVAHFCVLALAAMGCQSAMRLITRLRTPQRVTFAVVLGVLGLLGGLTLFFYVIPQYRATLEYLFSYQENNIEIQRQWVSRCHYFNTIGHALLFFSGGTLTLSLAVGFWPVNRRLRRRFRFIGYLGIALFVLFAVSDPALHARRFIPTIDIQRYLDYAVKYAPERAMREAADLRQEALPTYIDETRTLRNIQLIHEMRSTFGYHPVRYADYDKMIRACAPLNPSKDTPTAHCGGLLSPVFQELMGQNYRTVSERAPGPSPEWQKIIQIADMLALERTGRVDVVRVAQKVQALKKPWKDLTLEEWHGLLHADFLDPRNGALTDANYTYEWPGAEAPPSVDMTMLSSDRFLLSLPDGPEMPKGLVPCIVSIPAARGWRLNVRDAGGDAVDYNKSLWPQRINGFLMLVPLVSGGETTLEFAPASQRLGSFISFLTLAFIFSFTVRKLMRKHSS